MFLLYYVIIKGKKIILFYRYIVNKQVYKIYIAFILYVRGFKKDQFEPF